MNEQMAGVEKFGHRCKGRKTWTDYGYEYDCEYEPEFSCDECIFAQGYYLDDYRHGKRPWRKQ